MNKTKHRAIKAVRYIVIAALAVVIMIPIYWMVATSLRDPSEIFTYPIQWIPSHLQLDAYISIFANYDFGKYIWNTVVLCALNIVGTTVSCSLVAYAFAFGKYKHKNKLFLLVLATMVLPGAVTFFPQFILYVKIGWYGTLLPLWLPSFFGSAYYIFFLRQYFLTVPTSLMDAARIDGCGDLKTLIKIVVPMARPVYIVMVINTFIAVWGDFFNQLIYINSESQYTISMGLSALNQSYGHTSSIMPEIMAGAIIVSIPVLVVYYLGQKAMMQGYVFGEVGK